MGIPCLKAGQEGLVASAKGPIMDLEAMDGDAEQNKEGRELYLSSMGLRKFGRFKFKGVWTLCW